VALTALACDEAGLYLFLRYNPGYGFAFGFFKSLFVVLIWIYFSLALFLFGAEITASLSRGSPPSSKTDGRQKLPGTIVNYVVRFEKRGLRGSSGLIENTILNPMSSGGLTRMNSVLPAFSFSC
jgi:hypothetical protein